MEKTGKNTFSGQKNINIAVARLMSVAAAAFVLIAFGIVYQTNDDATLANIAAGAYGDSLHMIYTNMLFSVMMRPLYRLKTANWYVFIQLVLDVVSVAAVIYILLKKLGTVAGVIISTALLIAFAPHIYYTLQYTESGFIRLSAGLLLIVDSLGTPDKKTALGIFLCLMGSMLRWDSFYAVGGLSAALLLYRFFLLDNMGKKRAAITMAVLFALVFGAKAADTAVYKSDPAWNEFTVYNQLRTQYSDYKTFFVPATNPFEEFGLTDADYEMLRNWDFYDEGRFDIPMMENISADDTKTDTITLIKDTVKNILKMGLGESYNYMFLAVAVISLMSFRTRKASLVITGLFCTFGALVMYLTFRVRFTQWVTMGLLWAVIVFALYCIGEIKPGKKFICLLFSAGLLFIIVMSRPYYQTLMTTEKYICLDEPYFQQMSRDKENLYLLSTVSTNPSAGYEVMSPRSDNFYSNIVLLGGWLSRAPHRDAALNSYGLVRPVVDAVDNPHVYLDYHNIETIRQYARQEKGCPVYAVKTGDNPYAPYQLVTTPPAE